jgi:hypothetical protein
MPSASRSLLGDGPDVGRLRDTAARLAEEFRDVLRRPSASVVDDRGCVAR